MNRTVPFFFGMMNVGAAHSEWFTFRKTPMLHKHSTSVHKVCSRIFGEYGKASHPVEGICRTPRGSKILKFHRTRIRI